MDDWELQELAKRLIDSGVDLSTLGLSNQPAVGSLFNAPPDQSAGSPAGYGYTPAGAYGLPVGPPVRQLRGSPSDPESAPSPSDMQQGSADAPPDFNYQQSVTSGGSDDERHNRLRAYEYEKRASHQRSVAEKAFINAQNQLMGLSQMAAADPSFARYAQASIGGMSHAAQLANARLEQETRNLALYRAAGSGAYSPGGNLFSGGGGGYGSPARDQQMFQQKMLMEREQESQKYLMQLRKLVPNMAPKARQWWDKYNETVTTINKNQRMSPVQRADARMQAYDQFIQSFPWDSPENVIDQKALPGAQWTDEQGIMWARDKSGIPQLLGSDPRFIKISATEPSWTYSKSGIQVHYPPKGAGASEKPVDLKALRTQAIESWRSKEMAKVRSGDTNAMTAALNRMPPDDVLEQEMARQFDINQRMTQNVKQFGSIGSPVGEIARNAVQGLRAALNNGTMDPKTIEGIKTIVGRDPRVMSDVELMRAMSNAGIPLNQVVPPMPGQPMPGQPMPGQPTPGPMLQPGAGSPPPSMQLPVPPPAQQVGPTGPPASRQIAGIAEAAAEGLGLPIPQNQLQGAVSPAPRPAAPAIPPATATILSMVEASKAGKAGGDVPIFKKIAGQDLPVVAARDIPSLPRRDRPYEVVSVITFGSQDPKQWQLKRVTIQPAPKQSPQVDDTPMFSASPMY